MMKVSDPKVAEASYEILRESVETDPRVPADVIQQSLKLASRNDARVKSVDAAKAFDMRLAARSMESRK
jgi:hypothetical protein